MKTYDVTGIVVYDFDGVGQLVLKGIIDGEYQIVPAPVLPYGFVEDVYGVEQILRDLPQVVSWEKTSLLASDTKRHVIKFEVDSPKKVLDVRSELNNRGYKTYETDIPYVRRLMINKILKVNYSRKNIAYLDIETDDSKGFPKEYGEYEIVSVAVYGDEGEGKWFFVDDYNNEMDMLTDLMVHLMNNEMSVIVGWNVQFDYNHLLERLKRLKMYWELEYLKHCNTIDLMHEYMGAVKGLSSYSLEEVTKHENLERIKRRNMRIFEMRKRPELLRDYNMYDAEVLRILDKKYGFTDVKFEVAKQANLTLDILSQTRIGDALVIWRLRELGYVAVDRSTKEKKRYTGAYVIEPKPGLYDYVGYYDVNSLYPNVIIHKNIDIDGFNGEVIPHIEKKLLEDRAKYKKLYEETKDPRYNVMQNAKKILANGMYGLYGTPSFRYYNIEKAEAVTMGGREVLMKIKEFLENNLGLKVLYGDTDSVFVSLADAFGSDNIDLDAVTEFAEFVRDEINDYIKPFQVKLEAVLVKMLFLTSEGRGGVKKRYVGLKPDGSYLVRGLEVRRSDWSELSKEVMWKVIDMLLKEGKTKKDVMEYLSKVKRDLFAGKLNDKIVLTKTLNKDVRDYKVLPPHVRAYKKALKQGYEFTDGRVQFVWVRGGDVEPVYEGVDLNRIPIDYGAIWDKQIMSPVKRILKSVGAGKMVRLDSYFVK